MLKVLTCQAVREVNETEADWIVTAAAPGLPGQTGPFNVVPLGPLERV